MILDKINETHETVKLYMTGVIIIFMLVVFAFIFSLHAMSDRNIKQLERTNSILLLCEEAIIKNTDFNKNNSDDGVAVGD